MKTLLLACSVLVVSASSIALESIKLKDTINKGFGVVDILKPHARSTFKSDLTGEMLEAYKQQNAGNLVFAIDVNEAANGTEKASTQGVAVESAVLEFDMGGEVFTCNVFTTNTAAMLMKKGASQRSEYYTLIGATGSSHITPSTDGDIFGSDFGGTMTMPIDADACTGSSFDLTNVQTASLTLQFLETDDKLGDPEAFYDYSNGPEDIAILTANDVSFLNFAQIGVDEAPLVIAKSQVVEPVDSWLYYPTSDSYFVVSYEDQYPNLGDYDFNDLLIGYRVGFGFRNNEQSGALEVVSIITSGYMIARGASYDHDWYLHIPIEETVSGSLTVNLFKEDSIEQVSGYPVTSQVNNELDLKVLANSRDLMHMNDQAFVNTLADVEAIKGKKFSFTFNLDTPFPASSLGQPPYDPYLHVLTTGQEIHLPGKSTRIASSANFGEVSNFKDENNYPFALIFPDDFYPPLEGIDIGEAYSDFLNYTQSPEQSNETWYLSPDMQKTKNIGKAFWKW